MILLPTTENDINAILKIAEALPAYFTKTGVEYIKTDFFNQKGFIYKEKDETIGFILYFSNQAHAEIGWLAVLPNHQKKGVGQALFHEMQSLLKKHSCKSITVKTLDESVEYAPYEVTRNFYKKLGFKKIKVISHPDNPECEAEAVYKIDI